MSYFLYQYSQRSGSGEARADSFSKWLVSMVTTLPNHFRLGIFLFFLGLNLQAQVAGSVLSSQGATAANTHWQINSTLGEAIIFSQQPAATYYGQGFQTLSIERLTSTVEVEAGLSFEVTLYPNPNRGLLQVETAAEISHFRWFSSDGRLAGEAANRSNRLDLSQTAAGLYLLQARIGEQYYLIGRILRVEGQ